MNQEFNRLCKIRQSVLKAALIYYHGYGEDTGMHDYQWDQYAKLLYENRDKFPKCSILNSNGYSGGSMYFVKAGEFGQMLNLYVPE